MVTCLSNPQLGKTGHCVVGLGLQWESIKEKRKGSLGMRTVCVRLLRRYWNGEWGILRLLEVPRTTIEARVKKIEQGVLNREDSARLTKKPKLNFGDTEKAAHIVKLNEKGKINDNEMATRKDIKAKNPKKKDSSSSEETSVREKRQKYTNGKKNKKIRKSSESNDSSTEDESEEATCIFGSELYSNSKAKEGWIRCQHCGGWAHESCAGAGEDEVFILTRLGCENFLPKDEFGVLFFRVVLKEISYVTRHPKQMKK
ncbi:hypothetical protein JTB14_029449 [Gonioctena quinquepunctata]|nr:hypothetical protein JTB14_029449 [Gonioctena quinquepunctata]